MIGIDFKNIEIINDNIKVIKVIKGIKYMIFIDKLNKFNLIIIISKIKG